MARDTGNALSGVRHLADATMAQGIYEARQAIAEAAGQSDSVAGVSALSDMTRPAAGYEEAPSAYRAAIDEAQPGDEARSAAAFDVGAGADATQIQVPPGAVTANVVDMPAAGVALASGLGALAFGWVGAGLGFVLAQVVLPRLRRGADAELPGGGSADFPV